MTQKERREAIAKALEAGPAYSKQVGRRVLNGGTPRSRATVVRELEAMRRDGLVTNTLDGAWKLTAKGVGQ